MIVLIGIDDTDSKESRGTGFHARGLASLLMNSGNVTVSGVTRHQHYRHPDIPYTSQNSSACIVADVSDFQRVWDICSQYLSVSSASGSDAGLALAMPQQIDKRLTAWAYSTTKEVVNMEDAYSLAAERKIWLEGFTGNHQGIIGALASVALRNSGNNGRFIATGNNFHLRELQQGSYSAAQLLDATSADVITDTGFHQVRPECRILVKEYLRPVLHNQKCTILVTKTESDHDWESAGKDIIGNY